MNKVGPDGMIIVPAGQPERDTIVTESQSLAAGLEHATGYDVRT
jgi:hypothetical protein